MNTTDDPEVFRDRWNKHLRQLERLKQVLPPEYFDDLDEAREQLEVLVDIGAENGAGGDSE